jgi:hypothetical protein
MPTKQVTETVLTPTYSCSTTGSIVINYLANTTTLLAALVPTGGTNTKKITIQQILISLNGGNANQSTPFQVLVGMCSAASGPAHPILAHDRGDGASSMSFIKSPSSVTSQNIVPFGVSANIAPSAPGTVVTVTRANFPDGKPIVLRNGQAEGIFVYAYTDYVLTGQPFASVSMTWTEETD